MSLKIFFSAQETPFGGVELPQVIDPRINAYKHMKRKTCFRVCL